MDGYCNIANTNSFFFPLFVVKIQQICFEIFCLSEYFYFSRSCLFFCNSSNSRSLFAFPPLSIFFCSFLWELQPRCIFLPHLCPPLSSPLVFCSGVLAWRADVVREMVWGVKECERGSEGPREQPEPSVSALIQYGILFIVIHYPTPWGNNTGRGTSPVITYGLDNNSRADISKHLLSYFSQDHFSKSKIRVKQTATEQPWTPYFLTFPPVEYKMTKVWCFH